MEDSINSIIERVQTQKYHCLNISHRNLSVLPQTLESLSHLSVLLLNDNQLILPPSEILSLSDSLEELVLDGNKITLLPTGLQRFHKLKCLSLNRTLIGALTQEICGLQSLSYLWLNNCSLVALPKEIGLLENLLRLGIKDNQIQNLPKELSNLRSLRWISCASNRLVNLPEQMGELSHLQYADFNHNLFEYIPKPFYDMKNLKVLLLAENKISHVSDDALLSMSSMVKVDLRSNPMSRKPEHWKGMEFIRVGKQDTDNSNGNL